jgi:hypothetical protein
MLNGGLHGGSTDHKCKTFVELAEEAEGEIKKEKAIVQMLEKKLEEVTKERDVLKAALTILKGNVE